ncbi:MAG: carbon-nitrogen family hydrolase [Bacillota bacterium]
MRISLLQMDVLLGDTAANRDKVRKMVETVAGENPDVIVLPETWNVGFFPKNVQELADVDGEPALTLFAGLAKEYQVNIVGGSVANKENDQVYNTNYVFDRKGELISKYSKVHLFSPAGEHEYFQHGDKTSLFEIDGIKASAIICYDLRFVELVRTLALQGIHILFVPAQWPLARVEHWTTLLRARAIENQMFVVAVNGAGVANEVKFGGNSMIIDPWGEVLVNAGGEETIITGEINPSIVRDIREKINVFRDRKPLVYQI